MVGAVELAGDLHHQSVGITLTHRPGHPAKVPHHPGPGVEAQLALQPALGLDGFGGTGRRQHRPQWYRQARWQVRTEQSLEELPGQGEGNVPVPGEY